MNVDGAAVFVLARELSILEGARIDKIHQPAKNDLLFSLRAKSGNVKLLLSAAAQSCRAHITEYPLENPAEPPMFCMLLRKRLSGGRVVSITQPDMERILVIEIDAANELGDILRYRLIIEMMGRHSNIILTSPDGVIIDSARRVPEHVSRVRQVLPGLEYIAPPKGGKLPPSTISHETLLEILSHGTGDAKKALTRSLTGISPQSAMEICVSSLGEADISIDSLTPPALRRLASGVHMYIEKLKNPNPVIIMNAGSPVGFFPYKYASIFGEAVEYPTMSAALDAYFHIKTQLERRNQAATALRRVISSNLERCYKKMDIQRQAVAFADEAQKFKKYGELIAANAYALQKGIPFARVMDYTEETYPQIEIPLDSSLTPMQNSQRYYKKYNKARAARVQAEAQLELSRAETQWLESQDAFVESATTLEDLELIRLELIKEGYIKPQHKKGAKKRATQSESQPYRFISSDGIEILAGRNNTQNDRLTLRTAAPNDIWLHAKDIPGSHVIIRSSSPPDTTINEAAIIAAYYSRGRASTGVSVDIAPVKNIKKPSGARPGMVIYTGQRTVYVRPDEDVINSLKTVDNT
ncbi:MAG: Rqc2 family fibronectin-binding protein [Christensenellales bacterium]|jgi:predicted ribosome quality control (RQC) complex YloA/Tae2 family protein